MATFRVESQPDPACTRDNIVSVAAGGAGALLASGQLDRFVGGQVCPADAAPDLPGPATGVLVARRDELHAWLCAGGVAVHRRWSSAGRWLGDAPWVGPRVRCFDGVDPSGEVVVWSGYWEPGGAPRGGWSIAAAQVVPATVLDAPAAAPAWVREPVDLLPESPFPLEVVEDYELADAYSTVDVFRLALPRDRWFTLRDRPRWWCVFGDTELVWDGGTVWRTGPGRAATGGGRWRAAFPPVIVGETAVILGETALVAVRATGDERARAARPGRVHGLGARSGGVEVLDASGITWVDADLRAGERIETAPTGDAPAAVTPTGWRTRRGGSWRRETGVAPPARR